MDWTIINVRKKRDAKLEMTHKKERTGSLQKTPKVQKICSWLKKKEN